MPRAKVPIGEVSLETAVDLARSGEIGHQVTAATVMRRMAASRSSDVLAAGGVQALLHLLATSHLEAVHHAAATALASLAAASRDVRDAVVQSGGCTTLVRLLSDRQQRTQQAAAAAVWSLSVGGRVARCALAAAGAAAPLVKLLGNNVAARLAAASALYNLAHEPAAVSTIASAGGIPVLIKALTISKKKTKQKAELRQAQAAAAGTLWCIADSRQESRAVIGAEGGVQALVELLRGTVNSSVNGGAPLQAAGCLRCLAQDSDLQDAIRTAGAAQSLKQLLCSGTDDAKEQAAGALWRLARGSEAGAAAVADAGAIKPLVHALGSGSWAVQHQAAGCLCSLVRSSAALGGGDAHARQAAVLEAGGRPALQRLVRDSPGSAAAAEACGVLAELEASFPEPNSGADAPAGARTCRACSASIDSSDVWALAPCGHRGVCGRCAAYLLEPMEECPVCHCQVAYVLPPSFALRDV